MMTLVSSSYAPVNGLHMYCEVLRGPRRRATACTAARRDGHDRQLFAMLLPRLAETRRVIAVELQGHGHTSDIDRPLSYPQMADDTVALMAALDIGAADLVGDSLGGAVALQIALDRPELEQRIVYAGGTSPLSAHRGGAIDNGFVPVVLGPTVMTKATVRVR
jgi:pimeloyl-ACP methyl ester carboxylesterase